MELLLLTYFITATGRKIFGWLWEVACIICSLLQMLYHPILSVPQKTIYIISCAVEFPLGFAGQTRRILEKFKNVRREISEKRFFVKSYQIRFYSYSVTQIRRTILVNRQNDGRADPRLSFI